MLASKFKQAGWDITWLEHTKGPLSNSFIVHKGEVSSLNLLFLCHTDTVFKNGDTHKNPFRKTEDGKRYMGLGVYDMKASCLYALYIAEEIMKEAPENSGRVAFLFNGQEEISSIGTREVIEKYCKISKYVFALEPARANGASVKQRKGVSRYNISFTGKPAHSGVNPQDGESAILEMAHWITYIESLTDYETGLTVNCGIVKGGSSVNTVPEHAELQVDVRSVNYEDAIEADKKIKAKINNKANSKIDVVINGGITRPPMKPTAETEKLCIDITERGKKYGLDITWIATGGGSDASFASGVGVVTLDGLGPVGGKSHSFEEYVEIHELDTRYELLKETTLDLIK